MNQDPKFKVEICANSAESALKAQEGGAYRIELCAGIPEGGTTPSAGEIRMARALLKETKMHVIIRPRGGDFLYNTYEQEIMIDDIKLCRELGVDGIVIGCLTAEGTVDKPLCKKLIEAAGDMNVTFHRAFDMSRDPKEALEDIISLGCTRVLTSGQEPDAVQGIPLIKELVEQANGRIIVMPGGCVRSNTVRQIADETGATEFHLTCRNSYESGMIYRNPKVSMGDMVKIEEYMKDVTDPVIVKAAVDELIDDNHETIIFEYEH